MADSTLNAGEGGAGKLEEDRIREILREECTLIARRRGKRYKFAVKHDEADEADLPPREGRQSLPMAIPLDSRDYRPRALSDQSSVDGPAPMPPFKSYTPPEPVDQV